MIVIKAQILLKLLVWGRITGENKREVMDMIRVPFERMYGEFYRVLKKIGFDENKAALCGRLFAEASRDGVYTHGLNRFPGFVAEVKAGNVMINGFPEKVADLAGLEIWDGKLGPGNVNAHFSMNHAMELARQNGIGCVALRNTNHWMRGGAYGWQAAEAGYVGICWTNTSPLVPPWGATEPKVGNNPLILAVPRAAGPIVLDMSMTMFSFGKIETYIRKGELLPVDGGFTQNGEVTRNPKEILESRRPMPIGLWKGTGLALLLDLIGLFLSGGNSTYQLGKQNQTGGFSQIFLAFNISGLPHRDSLPQMVEEIIEDFHRAQPEHESEKVLYPGERVIQTRLENPKKGIPVEELFWNQVINM